MNRQDYIYQLAGKITDKRTKKKKDGTSFYQLAVEIEDKEAVSKINVFNDSCQAKVWQEIKERNHFRKEYIFKCKNYMGSYYLVDWEVIKNHEKN